MVSHFKPATAIEGSKIVNEEGEHIGDITDLLIDLEKRTVAYAVLSFGGFLGFGEKLFAIPLEAFEFGASGDEEKIILNVSKEHLENAPGFDKDNWPENADRTFISSVYSYYGFDPYWTRHK